ncbi:hypothetical protein JCM11641_007195 [Rhodosporidiobolus odoratus]
MFYNTEILTSRKGGFAVFWLAATIGSKGGTAVKKLSKAEVLKSNVVRACEKVIAPEEPLALRLSSNLMMGIARVYQQQYAHYANDVTIVHQAIKKAIAETTIATPDITLAPEPLLPLAPLPEQPPVVAKKAAQPQGLNMAVDNGVVLLGFDPDADVELDWHVPGEVAEEDEPMDLGEEPPFLSPVDLRAGTPAILARQPTAAHQAREADITLQEPQLDDYLLQGLGEEDPFQAGDLGGLDQPIFGDDEEGLLYGASPELDALIRASSAAGRGSAGGPARGETPQYGPSSSAVGAPVDMGGLDDQFFPQDFGGGFDGELHAGGQGVEQFGEGKFEERVRREHEEARARLENAGAMRRSPTPMADLELSREVSEGTPSSTTRKRISDALDQAHIQASQAASAARKPKKAKRNVFDPKTELSDEAFRNMRTSYSDRMAREHQKTEDGKQDRHAHQKAMDLVFGVPAMLQAPGLADFWKLTVSDTMVPFVDGTAEDKKRRVSPHKKAKEPTPEAEVSRRAKGRLSEQAQVAAGLGDFGDFYAGQEFGGGEGEVGRDYGGDMGGFEHQHWDEDVEQGRAGSEGGLTGSHRPSLLPWAQEAATSDVGGPLPTFGGPSSQAGGTRVSLDTPLRPHRAGSHVPSILGSSPHRAGSVGLLAERDDDFAAFEERRLTQSSSPHPSGAGTFEALALKENESLKFLNYARRQQATIAEDDQLLFSDVVPVADTNASTAAQALYHLLVLATKGMVRVQQDEAYGEIAVDIP